MHPCRRCLALYLVLMGLTASAQDSALNPAPDSAELEARQRYEEALARSPLQDTIFDKVYSSYLEFEGLDAWVSQLGTVETQQDPAKLILLGRIYDRQFKIDEAVAALEKAQALGEAGDDFLLLLGTMYYQARLDDNAIELLSHALDTVAKPEQRAESARMLGAVYARKGMHDEAIAAWKRLVEQTPDDIYAHLELAEIYEDNRMWPEAVAAYRKIVALATNDPYRQCRTLRSIGRSELHQERHSDAIAAFEQALELVAPGNWLHDDLKLRLVGVYQDLGDLDGLVAYLNGKIDAAPNASEFRDLLAETYARMGRFADAEAEYNTILERDPQRAPVYEKLILLYERMDAPEKVASAYEKLIAIYPSEPDYLRRLGEFHLRSGQPELAKTTWQRVLGSPPTARQFGDLAGWYEEHEYPDEAVDAYKQALALEPDKERTFRLAGLYHSLGREEEALAAWQSTLTESSAAADLAEVATVLESAQLVEEAASLWQAASEKDAANVEYRFALAKNFLRQEKYDQALPLLEPLANQADNTYIRDRAERAMVETYRDLGVLQDKQQEWRQQAEVGAGDDATLMQLGRFLEYAGDGEEALDVYHQALALAPENPDYLRTIARLYRVRGRVEEAIDTFNQLIAIDKERAGGYHRELVDIYLAADLRDHAIEAAQKVVENAPSNTEARLDLAQVYQNYQLTDEALQQYRFALRLEPNEPQYYRAYGEALAAERRFGEAQEAYRKMMEVAVEDETRLIAVQSLAGLYSEQDKLDSLKQEFRDRIRNTPKKLSAYEELAGIYQATGDPMRALEILEEAYQTVDDKVPALKSLVQSAYAAQDLERVVSYYKELVAQSGKPSVHELERLGSVYAQLGELEQAKETWAKILETEPDKSESYKTLARAYRQAGMTEDALAATGQAVELDPDNFRLRYDYSQNLLESDMMGESLEQLQIILERGGQQEEEEDAAKDDEKEKQVKRLRSNQAGWQQFNRFSANYSPGNTYYGYGWQGKFQEYRPQIIAAMARIAENSVGIEEFLKQFENRVETNPTSTAAKQDLMLIYQTINRPDDALKIGEELLAQLPDDVPLLQQLAGLYSWRQDIDRAAELMLHAIDVQPSMRKDGLIALVSLYQRKGDNAKFSETAQALLAEFPSDFQLQQQIAQLAQQVNELALLDFVRENAMNVDEQYRHYVLLGVARAYRAANKIDEARQLYQQVLEYERQRPPRTRARVPIYTPQLQASNQYYGSRSGYYQFQQVLQNFDYGKYEALEALVTMSGGDPEQDPAFAAYMESAKGYSDAEGVTAKHRARDAAVLIVTYYAGKEKYEEALGIARWIEPESAGDVEWPNVQLYCNEKLGKFDEMLRIYDELEKALPSRNRETLKAKTNTALLKGDYEQVAGLVREMRHQNVPPQEVVALVNHLDGIGEKEMAKSILEEHLGGLSRNAQALALLAKLHAEDREYEKAYELAQEAWKRQPQGGSRGSASSVYYGYYYAYGMGQSDLLQQLYSYAQGCAKTEALIAEFKERLDKQPGSIQNYENLVTLYSLSDDRAHAEALHRELIEKRPHYARARIGLAEFYSSKGRYQDALAVYEEVIEKTPSMYRSISWRIHDLYSRMGQGEKLAEIENKVVEGATNVNQLTQLAYEMRDRGNIAKATELFERIVTLDPARSYYISQLVECYLQSGRVEDAINRYATMLASPVSRNQLIIDNNGMRQVVSVYSLTGRIDELNAVVAELEAVDPNDRAAKAIRAQILKRNKEFERAIQILDEMIKSGNNYGAMNDLIEIATLQGNPQRVLDTLERSGMMQNYWNSQELVPVYLALGDKDKAYEALKQLANSYGGSYGFREVLEQLLRYQLYDQAADFYLLNRKKVGEDWVGREMDNAIVRAYTERGELQSLMDEILSKPMKGENLAVLTRMVESKHGNLSEVRTLVQPLVEREPENAKLKSVLAGALVQTRVWDEALPVYETLCTEDKNEPGHIGNLAQCLIELGRENEAVARAEALCGELLTLDRGEQLLKVFKNTRRGAKILDLRATALAALDPSLKPEVESYIADALVPLGGVSDKRAHLEQRVAEKKDAGSVRSLVHFLAQYGWEDETLDLLEAHREDGSFDIYSMASENMIDIAVRHGALDEYLAMLWKRLASENQYNRSYMLSRVYEPCARAGYTWLALDYLLAHYQDRDAVAAQDAAEIAGTSLRMGHDAQANTLLDLILENNPYNAGARLQKARALTRAGRVDEVMAIISEPARAESLMQELANQLAFARFLSEAGRSEESDAIVAEVASWAQSPEANGSIGHHYMSLWQCDRALPYLEGALRQNASSPDLVLDLVTAYAVLGKTQEARDLLATRPASNMSVLLERLLASECYDALGTLVPIEWERQKDDVAVISAKALAEQLLHGDDACDAVFMSAGADASDVQREALARHYARLLQAGERLERAVAREEKGAMLTAAIAAAFEQLSSLVPPTRAIALRDGVAAMPTDDNFVHACLARAFDHLDDAANAAQHWNGILRHAEARASEKRGAIMGLASCGAAANPELAPVIEPLLAENPSIVDEEPRILRLAVECLLPEAVQGIVEHTCEIVAYDSQRAYYRALVAHYQGDVAATDTLSGMLDNVQLTHQQLRAAAEVFETAQRHDDLRRVYQRIAGGGFERGQREEALRHLALIQAKAKDFGGALESWTRLLPGMERVVRNTHYEIVKAMSAEDADALRQAVESILGSRPESPLNDQIIGFYTDACNALGVEPQTDQVLASVTLPEDTVQRATMWTARISNWLLTEPRYGLGLDENPTPAPDVLLALGRGDAVADASGQPKWQQLSLAETGGIADLNNIYQLAFDAADDNEAYAICWLESPDARTVTFTVGYDDNLMVWVNGQKVFAAETDMPLAFDQGRFNATLKPGPNTVLVRIVNASQDWGFYVGFADGHGGITETTESHR